jgi:hypothetical protein
MNFLMRLSTGLEIQIHESERRGRRAKDWRSSSRIVEPYWFWMAWSLCKIPLVHKKDGCVSLPCGGWARSVSGSTAEGIAWIEDGIRDYRAAGSMLRLPYYLALKAEGVYLANHIPEALETIREAEGVVERFEERGACAELHRLRGAFLATSGGDEMQIEASFCAAIRIAREQKSISTATRAEATCAEYRRQKVRGTGGSGFRLSLDLLSTLG